jgi:hypothetical protein
MDIKEEARKHPLTENQCEWVIKVVKEFKEKEVSK